jgi:hypothetical protein
LNLKHLLKMKTTFILSSVVALYALVAVDAAGATSTGAGFGAIQIKKAGAGATILSANPATDNHFCWTAADASAPSATACAGAGSLTDFGTSGCSGKNGAAATLLWKTPKRYLNIVECKADGSTKVGSNLAVTVYQTQITEASLSSGLLTINGLGTGNHLCWTATSTLPTTATAVTCGAPGPATDPGTTGCGAKDAAALTWVSPFTNKYTSVQQCTETTNAATGVAVAIELHRALGSAFDNHNDNTLAFHAGTKLTTLKGEPVAVTGAGKGTHLCWTASDSAITTDTSCAVASNETDIGTSGCSAAADNNLRELTLTTVTKYINLVECNAIAKVGNAIKLEITEIKLAFASDLTTTKDVKIGTTFNILAGSTATWMCWMSSPYPAAALTAGNCGAKSTKVELGASGCSNANIPSLSFKWNGSAKSVSAIECSAVGTPVTGSATTFSFTLKNLALLHGAEQSLRLHDVVSVDAATLANNSWVCWTSGTSLTAITECSPEGTSTNVGKTGCGAKNNSSFFWNTATGTNVSMIECYVDGTTVAPGGSAISLKITDTGAEQLAETKAVKVLVESIKATVNTSSSTVPVYLLGLFAAMFSITI